MYVLVVSRRRLGPGALELGGERLAVLGSDLALFGAEIGFVANNDERDPIDRLLGWWSERAIEKLSISG